VEIEERGVYCEGQAKGTAAERRKKERATDGRIEDSRISLNHKKRNERETERRLDHPLARNGGSSDCKKVETGIGSRGEHGVRKRQIKECERRKKKSVPTR